MQVPESLDVENLSGRVQAREVELTPRASQVNEGMMTARERRASVQEGEEKKEKNEKSESQKRLRRRKGSTRFAALSKGSKRRQQPKKTPSPAPNAGLTRKVPPVTPLAMGKPLLPSTTSATPVALPLQSPLRWDEELDNETPSPRSLYSQSHAGHDAAQAQAEMNQRMEGLAVELLAIKDLIVQRREPQAPAATLAEQTKDNQEDEANHLPIFSTTELEELQISAQDSHQRMQQSVKEAEDWVRRLSTNKLKPMAKAMGRVISATSYGGDPQPMVFAAWCDSVRTAVAMWDLPPGPSQVQAATWFIRGRAKAW